jgi:hypothetical protein
MTLPRERKLSPATSVSTVVFSNTACGWNAARKRRAAMS